MVGALSICGAVLFVHPMTVHAEEWVTVTVETIQDGDCPEPVDPIADGIEEFVEDTGSFHLYNAEPTAEQALYSGLYNAQTDIDLSSYNITAAQLSTLFQKIMDSSPELFFVKNTFSYSYVGDYVTTAKPQYKATGSTLSSQRTFYNNQINYIAGLVNSSWSDTEKILFVNDYLAQNYEYDTSYTYYDAYNFLYRKTGVCQSYTLVVEALMKKLGVNVSYASSSSMNHIWNVVQIGGNWYHVDVTWDDPTTDQFGLASHDNLLRSNTGITSTGHSNWSTTVSCSNTKYDNYFWQDSNTPFQNINNTWYYAKYNSSSSKCEMYSCSVNSASSTKLFDIGLWTVYGNAGNYYPKCFSGLDVYDGELYFNTLDSLKKYSPSTGNVTVVKTLSGLSGIITGMRMNSNTITYSYTTNPNNKGTTATYSVTATPSGEEPSHEGPADGLVYTNASDTRFLFYGLVIISALSLAAIQITSSKKKC